MVAGSGRGLRGEVPGSNFPRFYRMGCGRWLGRIRTGNGEGDGNGDGKGNGEGNGNGDGKGNVNGEGKGKGEIQGSLHCAADDEAVRCFGRDDVPLFVGLEAALRDDVPLFVRLEAALRDECFAGVVSGRF
jgi:hypothetical protein